MRERLLKAGPDALLDHEMLEMVLFLALPRRDTKPIAKALLARFGTLMHRAALAAFDVEGLHANDIAALLDSAGICIRSGHHCTQPLHRHYGLAGTARAQAALTQKEARLLVYATRPPAGDSDKFYRYLRVVIAETPGNTGAGARWTPVGSPVLLPSGISVVPTSTTGFLAAGVTWPTNPAPVSTFLATAAARYTIIGDTATSAADTFLAVQFAPDGAVTPATGAKLVLATATLANGLPQFNNAGSVRGLLVRPSGAITRVNEAGSF
jgi:hypothetical protein